MIATSVFGSRSANLSVIAGDIDGNGDHDVVLAKDKDGHAIPVRGRECSSQEMPFILNQFPTYDAFAKAELSEILPADYDNRSVQRKINTFSSVLLLSDDNARFRAIELPVECQTGPIKAFAVKDLNNDGNLDLIARQGNSLLTMLGQGDGTFNVGLSFGN